MFGDILEQLITESVVSIDDINDAIDNHKRIIINYKTKGEDKALGPRIAEIYAYGLTKAGNPVIRAFEPYGDTTTRVPHWKFFRLDRIIGWKETKQRFTKPADYYYKGLGEFNPNGDDSMSVVYKVAKFGNETVAPIQHDLSQPRKKEDIYKTDTERKNADRFERLKQQLDNPITLSDIKTADSFNSLKKDTTISSDEPKLKPQAQQKPTETSYKDEVTQSLNPLRDKIANARKIDLSKVPGYNKKYGKKEMDDLRSKVGDTSKPISFGELNKRLASQEVQHPKNVEPSYKDEVTKSLDPLRNKIANARKIDLSRIPKR